MEQGRTILHVDMDAFFAAVEVLDDPSLAGKPVVVGADPKGGNGRGVVATCSYEARKYGIHSAMPISQAYRLCPHAVYLRGRMARYGEVSDRIRKVFEGFTPLVEPASLDEAYLDVTESRTLFGDGEAIARRIKEKIRGEIGLSASVGVAACKYVAKIASDLHKPDGLTVVPPGEEIRFLHPLPISRLHGVGERTEELLLRMGIRTIGDLARFPQDALESALGTNAAHFRDLSNGIDDSPVSPEGETKSISNETTYPEDVSDPDVFRRTLLELSDSVASRSRAAGLAGRTVTFKLRYGDFTTLTRHRTLPAATSATRTIHDAVLALLEKLSPRRPVRLLGVGLMNLVPEGVREPLLFDPDVSRRKVDGAVDAIRERFGDDLVKPARLLGKSRRRENKR